MNALTAMKQALDVLRNKAWDEEQYCIDPDIAEAYDLLIEAITKMERVEPSFVDLLREAEEIVEKKSVWKRFIDGTPLSNDVPVWMADFAMEHGIYQPVDPAAHPQDRDAIIEECAAIADELAIANREQETDSMWQFYECAAAIRALKGKK